MHVARKLVRTTAIAGAFAYSVVEVILTRPRTRAKRAAWLSQLCKRLLRAAHIRLTVSGTVPDSGAIISNHLSYVDIILHGASHPCVFVSKIEVRRLPLFGWISMMAGTVYVERGAGGSAAKAAQGMAKGFRDGLPVIFFPEGTTGVGDVPVMTLHTGLLAQAIDAKVPIRPAFIRYGLPSVDLARGCSPRNDIHWGPQTMPAHLWNLLGLTEIFANLHFSAEPIAFTPAAVANRKVAALEAHAAMVALSQDAPEPHVSR